MNINEKVNVYTENKGQEIFNQIVKEIYRDGYEAGYNDCENDFQNINIEFIDFGLPSGTLWATDYLRNDNNEIIYIPYEEAIKYNIPSEEQWAELREHCKIAYTIYGGIWIIKGKNGKRMEIKDTGFYARQKYNKLYTKEESHRLYFWLSGLLDNQLANSIMGSYSCSDPWGNYVVYNTEVVQQQRYNQLPILLVKKIKKY